MRIVRPLLILAAFLALLIAAGWFFVGRINLGTAAANYLSNVLGRKVTIGALRIHPGMLTEIQLRNVTIANIAGGTDPAMITLNHLKATIPLRSLLADAPVVQAVSIEGVELLLEHGPDGRPNWKFRAAPAATLAKKPNRTVLPTLLNAHFQDVTVDFRTTGGTLLRTVVKAGSVTTATADSPIALNMTGTYNAAPFDLTGGLSSFTALHRSSVPFPAKIKLETGTTTLEFNGTFTDPLDVDGANGMLTLNVPSVPELAKIIGADGGPDIPFKVTGAFVRTGDRWRLSGGTGALAGQNFTATTLELNEGAEGQPDAVAVTAKFDTLDTNAFPKSATGAAAPSTSMSLMQDPSPDVLLSAGITAAHVIYGGVTGSDFGLSVKTGPGSISIDDLTLGVAGGTTKTTLSIVNKGAKAIVNFESALNGVNLGQLNKALGWSPISLDGPLTSHVTGSMIGANMDEARRTNRIFVAAAMAGGTIDRELVRMASTDVRSLFGSETGNRRLVCLLLIANLRDGTGTIGPLRIKTSSGTIAGSGTYNTVNDTIDVVIGAQSKSWWKLDVPVRIAGPVSDFSAMPAFGAGSRVLANISLPGDLPQAQKDIANGSACLKP